MREKNNVSHNELSKADLLRKRKQDLRKRKIIFYGCFSFFVLILIIGFFWLPFLRIQSITLSPVLTLNSDEVVEFTEKQISGSALLVLPKNNVFLVNKNKLIENLKIEYSVIDTVEIHKEFTSLNVTIVERTPKTIWCIDQTKGSPCYFIHDDGVIFEEAGEFSNPLFFVFYTPLESTQDPIGLFVLPQKEFERVNQIREVFAKYGIRIYGYQKNSTGDELFFLSPIILDGTQSAYIKSQQVQSVETIVSKMITALKNSEVKRTQDEHFMTLEYVDVRFNDQVSFKVK